MNKKSIFLGATALILGGLAILPHSIQAYQGNPSIKGPNCTPERHEAMEKAFANNDYNSWKELMFGKGKVTQIVNQNNFARFAQAHKLAEAGKTEEATKIRQELGLGLGKKGNR
jgi:hypothetical protein